MVYQPPHVLTIDLSAVAANYRFLQQKTGGTLVGVSIKADAYGLGAARVVPVLYAAGCRHFFVATAAEGHELRRLPGFEDCVIYVLGGIGTGEMTGLVPVLNSLHDIALFKGGPCAVFFDTGLNRLGLGADETARLLSDSALLDGLDLTLFMSHFACADDPGHAMNLDQCARIAAIRAALAPRFPAARWSMCNSSGVFHYPQAHYDMARCGYAVYGGNPTPESSNPMTPVVRLEARVLQTRKVRTGQTVGYGATHRFEQDAEVATICLGYADGFARAQAAGQAVVYWHGRPCPVLGRVSMDLVTIGTGHLEGPRPAPGDLIEAIGPHQGIDALAAGGGTIGYEILTSLGRRIPRIYID